MDLYHLDLMDLYQSHITSYHLRLFMVVIDDKIVKSCWEIIINEQVKVVVI